jgi:hypothetical protein
MTGTGFRGCASSFPLVGAQAELQLLSQTCGDHPRKYEREPSADTGILTKARTVGLDS